MTQHLNSHRFSGVGLSRALLLALVGLLLAADSATAVCTECTPARPVTRELWGELEPVDPNPLPSLRDSTRYNGNQFPGINLPLFVDIDVENGYLFVVYSSGFQIWNANQTPASPVRLAVMDGWEGHLPRWGASGENVEIMHSVDAPEGNDKIVAVVGRSPAGLLLLNTTNKADPKAMYQHHAVLYRSVHTARIGGQDYAFAGGFGGTGLHVYNMSAAQALSSTCVEEGTAEAGQRCPGVYVGRIGDTTAAGWVHGAGNFLAVTSGGVPFGIKLWDVSSPSSARLIVNGLPDLPVTGAALWQNPSTRRYYLATRLVSEARIFDVTQCLTAGCSSFSQNQLWSTRLPSATGEERATLSWSNDIPVIHFGSANNNAGPHRDFLFDVSDPTAPREIIPRNPDGSLKTITVSGATIDYWSWYYEGHPTGFSEFQPLGGVFWGDYFYRSMRTIFDIHRWSGPPNPRITVTGPTTGWQGDSIGFSALPNTACPATAGGWTWSPGGGTLLSGAGTNNVTLRWDTVGAKIVSATNSGCPGAEVITATIEIKDPTARVSGITVSPATPNICNDIHFVATGADGKPPLSFHWQVFPVNPDGSLGAAILDVIQTDATTAEPEVFDLGHSLLPGAGEYEAQVSVSNASNPTGATVVKRFTVGPLDPLGFVDPALIPESNINPWNDPFSFGTVQLHVRTQGATEWAWDFDPDGTGNIVTSFGPWTTDPALGLDPIFEYQTTGTKFVRVQIRNCDPDVPVQMSSILPVSVLQVDPLKILRWEAICSFAPCSFDVGQTVKFDIEVSGNPEKFEFDWTGNGIFQDQTSLLTPIAAGRYQATHIYTQAGNFSPVLRLSRGTEQISQAASRISVADPVPQEPPSISLTGPTSGAIGDALRFTASASFCTPSTSGWNWSTSGGQVTQTNNLGTRSTVTIQWSSTGFKTVRVTNSACSGASASRTVNITSSTNPPPGGGLNPNFTFTPTTPTVGQQVSFDGSSSTGNIAAYDWKFGDSQSASGAQVTHTFAVANTYKVDLTVTEPGCFSPSCAKTLTKNLTVTAGQGPPPPPPPPPSGELSAKFTFTPSQPETGQSVSFDGRSSTGNIAMYDWNFGDGKTASGAQVAHVFQKPNDYPVRLTVTEPNCASASCSKTLTKMVTVTGEAPRKNPTVCADNEAAVCLLANRFKVTVDWRNPRDGSTGPGKPIAESPLGPTLDSTGFFWFFRSDTTELVVKVIDARQSTGFFWFFYGGLSDVEYWITVTDQQSGQTKAYHNDPFGICGEADTQAFLASGQNDSLPVLATGEALVFDVGNDLGTGEGSLQQQGAGIGVPGACVSGPDTLCLFNDRFEVKVTWKTDEDGIGHAVPSTDVTGYFWFFRSDNIELVTKIIDARNLTGKIWFFYGALSTVEYEITVRDTQSGLTRTYRNEPGEICGKADTEAF